jgi:WD40-like Beta Propeller Repeat/Dipeptidyl peptidase IV (DPP IV) N-terminal region
MRTVFSPLRASAGAALLLVLTSCGGEDIAAPATGSLTVSAPTNGPIEPVTDYSVVIDFDPAVALHANGSVTISDLTGGAHVVRLDGAPAGCAVSGDNPRSVDVIAGETSSTSFDITCTTAGSLEITTSTTGDGLDPDGYQVTVLGGESGVPVPINGVTTISGVTAGDHTLLLTGIAANCELQQDNPSTVTVQARTTTSISLEVTCRVLGALEGVILFESGLGGGFPRHHLFRMKDDGSSVTDLTPEADGEDGVISPGGTRIAFTSYRSGNRDIYLMDPDGNHVTQITHDPEDDHQPAWSPDGSKIAFASTRAGLGTQVWVMNADGTGATQITAEGGFQPAWSPDGQEIAFSRVVKLCLFDVCSAHIFVAKPNGESATDISGSGDKIDYDPAWSPDGTRIAFEENRNIWIMEADGSGRVQLTGQESFVQDFAPIWSPDGSKIAFERSLNTAQIFVMNADGSHLTNLSNNSEAEAPTSWR